VGQYQQAVDSYNECIRQRPEFGETYWSLANLKTYRFDDTALGDMQRRVAAGGLTMSSEVNFHFAIAKALEDSGDFERAWEYYTSGNRLQRKEVSYDPVQTEVINDRLIATYSASSSRRTVEAQSRRRTDLHRRAAALGFNAARADPREPAQSRAPANYPTSAASPPG
jgi:tetratricopeptide (TPR) repeat protein